MPGSNAACSVNWKKLSGTLFSVSLPILVSSTPVQTLVSSSGSNSNLSKVGRLDDLDPSSQLGNLPALMWFVQVFGEAAVVAGGRPPWLRLR